MNKKERMQIRQEIMRANQNAELLYKKSIANNYHDPAMMADALGALASCLLAVMDSFGIQDVTIEPATILRAGRQTPDMIIQQHDHHGKIIKTVTLGGANLSVPGDAT